MNKQETKSIKYYEVDIDYDLYFGYFKCIIKANTRKQALNKAHKLPFGNKVLNIAVYPLTNDQVNNWGGQLLIIE